MRFLAALAVASASAPAVAHSPIEGMSHFYGGMLHPFLVLSHGLCLLAFSLWVGQCGVRTMRWSYPALLVSMIVGLSLAGFSVPLGIASESTLLMLTAGCGLLVALHLQLPVIVVATTGAMIGLLVGADSGVDGLNRQQTFAALLGCWLGAAIGLVIVAGLVEALRRPWQKVAVRVLGSWGTASAVLVLALAVRG